MNCIMLPRSAHLIVVNWFHALDVSRTFNVTSPPFTGLALPYIPLGGPLGATVGAIWPSSDGNSLDLFGSEFGNTTLSSQLLWRYNVSGDSWSIIDTNGVEQVPPIEGASCWIPPYGANKNGLGVYLGGVIPRNVGDVGTADEEYVSSTLLFDMVSTSAFHF